MADALVCPQLACCLSPTLKQTENSWRWGGDQLIPGGWLPKPGQWRCWARLSGAPAPSPSLAPHPPWSLLLSLLQAAPTHQDASPMRTR